MHFWPAASDTGIISVIYVSISSLLCTTMPREGMSLDPVLLYLKSLLMVLQQPG
jgi:hypothetical protein